MTLFGVLCTILVVGLVVCFLYLCQDIPGVDDEEDWKDVY